MKHSFTPYIFAGMLAFAYPAVAETGSSHPDATTTGMSSGNNKGVNSETRNWDAHKKYWQENYSSRPYYEQGQNYSTYEPAYRYGVDAYNRNPGKSYDELDANELRTGWDDARGNSTLDWNDAQDATRDAYERMGNTSSRNMSGTTGTATGTTGSAGTSGSSAGSTGSTGGTSGSGSM
jgi:hypothetical protein